MKKKSYLSELAAFAQNWDISYMRMDQREGDMKMNFNYFQIQKWMLQTVRMEKVDGKIGSFV